MQGFVVPSLEGNEDKTQDQSCPAPHGRVRSLFYETLDCRNFTSPLDFQPKANRLDSLSISCRISSLQCIQK